MRLNQGSPGMKSKSNVPHVCLLSLMFTLGSRRSRDMLTAITRQAILATHEPLASFVRKPHTPCHGIERALLMRVYRHRVMQLQHVVAGYEEQSRRMEQMDR